MKETLGLICLVWVLAVPTKSLSDSTMSTATNGHVGQAPSALTPENEVEPVAVEIRSRLFMPQRILLFHDHKTVLRFRNHDTELHTVVAPELFLGGNFIVGGNGAQEFGPEGLKRVIIPPDGLIEFQFTPARTGTFSYLCDMPGHNMQGVIVVE